VTVGVFVLGPLLLLVVGGLVMPRLVAQAERFAGWATRANPEAEVARLLESYVGPSAFRQKYGGPDDERFRRAFQEFRQTGERHVDAYNQFPKLEDWLEGGFDKQFTSAERLRVRTRLAEEGTSRKTTPAGSTNGVPPGSLKDAVDREVAAAKGSPAYMRQFR